MLSAFGSGLDGEQTSLAGDALIVLSTLFAASYAVFSASLAAHFPTVVLASAQQRVSPLYTALWLTLIPFLELAVRTSGWANPPSDVHPDSNKNGNKP